MEQANRGNLEEFIEFQWDPYNEDHAYKFRIAASAPSDKDALIEYKMPSSSWFPTSDLDTVSAATARTTSTAGIVADEDDLVAAAANSKELAERAHQQKQRQMRLKRLREEQLAARIKKATYNNMTSSSSASSAAAAADGTHLSLPPPDPRQSLYPNAASMSPMGGIGYARCGTKRVRYLSAKEMTLFFLDICKGLSHLHKHGIIHRDLKPSNLLLHDDGPSSTSTSSPFHAGFNGSNNNSNNHLPPKVLISDFGECAVLSEISQRRGSSSSKPSTSSSGSGSKSSSGGGNSNSGNFNAAGGPGSDSLMFTRTGATGTLEFMAPELLSREHLAHFKKMGSSSGYSSNNNNVGGVSSSANAKVGGNSSNNNEDTPLFSPSSDLWSLGIILYYIAYSAVPYSQIEDIDALKAEILAFQG